MHLVPTVFSVYNHLDTSLLRPSADSDQVFMKLFES
jgi:hypothetical protein